MRLLVAMAASSILTLAGAHGLGYVPSNDLADGGARVPDRARETSCDVVAAAVAACAKANRRWAQGTVDGVLVARCELEPLLPNLGVMSMPTRAQQRRVAIRNLQGREAEDLAGPLTHTRPVRTGAPSGSPGRAGSDVEGARP